MRADVLSARLLEDDLPVDDPAVLVGREADARPDKVESVEVYGRRWWRRGYGGEYNTADIVVNGKQVHTLPMQGGGGDYFLQRAAEWLERKGYLNLERHSSGGLEPLWRAARRLGFSFKYYVTDVKRQRDL